MINPQDGIVEEKGCLFLVSSASLVLPGLSTEIKGALRNRYYQLELPNEIGNCASEDMDEKTPLRHSRDQRQTPVDIDTTAIR